MFVGVALIQGTPASRTYGRKYRFLHCRAVIVAVPNYIFFARAALDVFLRVAAKNGFVYRVAETCAYKRVIDVACTANEGTRGNATSLK